MSFYTVSPVLGSVIQIKSNESGQYIVAVTNFNALWYSGDYGVTFTKSSISTDEVGVPIGGSPVITCSADGSKWACINTLGVNTGLITSNDYGVTWGLANTYVYSSVTSNADFSRLTAVDGSSSSTFTSYDEGSSWTDNLTTVTLFTIDGKTNHLVGVNGDGNVYLSNDYGITWIVTSGTPPITVDLVCIDETGKIIYAAYKTQGPSLFIYSVNGGLTWESVTVTSWIYTISCSNDGVVASLSTAYGADAGSVAIYYTTNSGKTWSSSPFITSSSTDNWDCSCVSGNGFQIASGYYGEANVYLFTVSPSPICYSKGTLILCKEGYIPIEKIVPGTLVKTYKDGYLPVKLIGRGIMINDPGNPFECMYRLPCSGDMTGDLVVTGGHGILRKNLSLKELRADADWFNNKKRYSMLDGFYVSRSYVDRNFVRVTGRGFYEYYHFSLDGGRGGRWGGRYGVWANGVLTESTFDRDILKLRR